MLRMVVEQNGTTLYVCPRAQALKSSLTFLVEEELFHQNTHKKGEGKREMSSAKKDDGGLLLRDRDDQEVISPDTLSRLQRLFSFRFLN